MGNTIRGTQLVLLLSATATLQAAVQVTYPNGGEMMVAGNTVNITWSGITAGTLMLIDYTIDGVNWIVLDDNYPSTGGYIWTVPNTPSTTCKVAVYASAFDGDLSNANFTIVTGVGLGELPTKAVVNFFPNPARNEITIDLTGQGMDPQFIMADLSGRKWAMRAETSDGAIYRLVFDEMMPIGVYLIEIIGSGGWRIAGRIVIQ